MIDRLELSTFKEYFSEHEIFLFYYFFKGEERGKCGVLWLHDLFLALYSGIAPGSFQETIWDLEIQLQLDQWVSQLQGKQSYLLYHFCNTPFYFCIVYFISTLYYVN